MALTSWHSLAEFCVNFAVLLLFILCAVGIAESLRILLLRPRFPHLPRTVCRHCIECGQDFHFTSQDEAEAWSAIHEDLLKHFVIQPAPADRV